ncbi:hypothetical protein [Pseudomonas sp. OHS18]|uniref:hypothetical protein n=1 Tax=Pseudomonas sp. OHS18 TaxID=3399679 RepID=UPI003A839B17
MLKVDTGASATDCTGLAARRWYCSRLASTGGIYAYSRAAGAAMRVVIGAGTIAGPAANASVVGAGLAAEAFEGFCPALQATSDSTMLPAML